MVCHRIHGQSTEVTGNMTGVDGVVILSCAWQTWLKKIHISTCRIHPGLNGQCSTKRAYRTEKGDRQTGEGLKWTYKVPPISRKQDHSAKALKQAPSAIPGSPSRPTILWSNWRRGGRVGCTIEGRESCDYKSWDHRSQKRRRLAQSLRNVYLGRDPWSTWNDI